MTGRPRVDVGVVTWNTRDLTVDALRRLVSADSGCDLRVLVRDNGSSDGTADAVRAAVPGAEVDAGADNLGFAAGVNTLLARSDAPWFLALNSDAWPLPGAVRRLVEVAERWPRAAAVAPRLERPDGSLEHSTYPFPSLAVAAATAVGNRLVGRERARRMCLEGAWRHDEPRAVDWAVGAALLLRREAVDDVGPFDERFFMYVEDVEWCWRAHRDGWEVRFDPSARVCHVGNASGGPAFGRRRTRAHVHNAYRFYRRHHGPVSTQAYRALNLAGSLRHAVAGALTGDRTRTRLAVDHLVAHLTPVAATDAASRPTFGELWRP